MARAKKYASINFNHIYDKNISNTSSNNVSNPAKHPSSSTLYSTISSSSSSSNPFANPSNIYKNHLPSTRAHGRMLVLTRPTSNPVPSVPPPPLSPSPQTPPALPAQPEVKSSPRSESESDQISLRPLGRTGTNSSLPSPVPAQERSREVGAVVGSPKSNKFVPPHLRPGFVGREERPGPVQKQQHQQQHHQQQQQQHHQPQHHFQQQQHHQQPQQHQQQQQHQQGHFGSPGRYGYDRRPKSGGGYEKMQRDGQSDLGLMNRPRSSGTRPSSSGWFLLLFPISNHIWEIKHRALQTVECFSDVPGHASSKIHQCLHPIEHTLR